MNNRLFVGGIPWRTTEEELGQFFAQIGEVTNVKIILDHETNRSRGFGFVEFARDDHANEAISKLDNIEFNGRKLIVKKANPRKQ